MTGANEGITLSAALSWLLVLSGCGAAGDASDVEPGLEVGVPDPATGLEYESLAPGGEIVLGTFGQGGTHATLAVQCWGFGDEAYVSVSLRNLDGPGESASRVLDQPEALACQRRDGAEICTRMPIFVTTNGLDPSNVGLDGLHVEVTATVRSRRGTLRSTTTDAYLMKREP
jgi:hypothetical protein